MSYRDRILPGIRRTLLAGGLLRKLTRRRRPRLSVVFIAFNMQREAPRALYTLSTSYQENIGEDDYEVLVMENGSQHPLQVAETESLGGNFSYHYLHDPPPSPAHAINLGVSLASGEYVCILIDGACMVTPGVLSTALRVFRTFVDPIILTKYFYLGPDCQNDSINNGYDCHVEDALLTQIGWRENGYRLFEIGTPLRLVQGAEPNWFQRPCESNCLFVRKSTFEQVGGCDTNFDIAGGGLASFDLLHRLTDLPATTPVQLIGEGTFHQVHGGTTTNTSPEDRDTKVELYKQQYAEIRGRQVCAPRPKRVHFFGRPRTPAASTLKHRINDKMQVVTEP